MDFFGHQDEARSATRRLVVLFLLAVVAILVFAYLVVLPIYAGVLTWLGLETRTDGAAYVMEEVWVWWHPELALWLTVWVVVVVGLGSLLKTLQLRGGGAAIALRLGGEYVNHEDGRDDEGVRRLLHVVEEMAIASGVPAPAVFVLHREPGINAFAAGWSIDDAAIAVTRGALDTLDRDELQGVIAHEFSHVVHGDMRLNTRLMGVLHGILSLGLLGRWCLYHGWPRRVEGRTWLRGRHQGAWPLVLAGLALMTIGYVGWALGQMIKAGISRQREFLADAAAVQFTRNPTGLAGALKKIGGLSGGSFVSTRQAEEASHMFFGNPMPKLGSWLSFRTHPPLGDRIKRLDPAFDGEFTTGLLQALQSQGDEAGAVFAGGPGARAVRASRAVGLKAPPVGSPAAPKPPPPRGAPIHLAPAALSGRIGSLESADPKAAVALMRRLPDEVLRAAHDPLGATALLYALLLVDEPAVRRGQMERMERKVEPAVVETAWRLLPRLQDCPPELRLPLVDLASPRLRDLSDGQRERLQAVVQELVKADDRIDAFEFALVAVLRARLASIDDPRSGARVRFAALRPLVEDCAAVLTLLARAGQEAPDDVQRAFDAGADHLRGSKVPRAELGPAPGVDQVTHALGRLRAASPAIKRMVMNGCAACVLADGRVLLPELELLRAVAASLECPLPPLAAG